MKTLSLHIVIALMFMGGAASGQDSAKSSGQTQAKGELVDGKKNGKWTFYYPNGKKQAVEHYEMDKLNGLAENFDFEGNILSREQWRNGLPQDSAFYYYSSGSFEKKGFYKDGQYEGEWLFFYPNAMLKKKVFYSQGQPNGIWQYYNEYGVLIQKGEYKEGKETGEWKFYDDKGRLQYIGSYQEGIRIGQWFFVTKSGKRKLVKFQQSEN